MTVVDNGYDFLVYEQGDADVDFDLGQFRAGEYLVEVKAARGNDVKMTPKQAATAVTHSSRYVLCVVDLRNTSGFPASVLQVATAIRMLTGIGEILMPAVSGIISATSSTPGVTIDQTGQLRYCIAQTVWGKGSAIENWVTTTF